MPKVNLNELEFYDDISLQYEKIKKSSKKEKKTDKKTKNEPKKQFLKK